MTSQQNLFFIGYITFVKVVALMGNQPLYDSEGLFPKGNLLLKIVLSNGKVYQAELNGSKYQGHQHEEDLNTGSDFKPPLICTREEIRKVHLTAQGNNRWYVASIDTYTAGSHKTFTKLTNDPGFSMWVDGNEEHHYPYQAKEHLLTNAVAGSCITYIRVEARTKEGMKGDGSLKMDRKSYFIILVLTQDQNLRAELVGYELRSQSSVLELNFVSRFQTKRCVPISEIKEVRLQTHHQGNENWYISSIQTSAKTGEEQYMDLTSDPHLNKWFRENDSKEIKLKWIHLETLTCEYGNPTCECMEHAEICEFNLEIDEIQTFTSYQKLPEDEPTGLAVRGTEGVSYYFDENGIPLPLQFNRICSTFDPDECTYPQYVDGKSYRMVIAVNGQVPAPTLIVYEGQKVIIHVHNNLTTEGISIHWHGMHQRGTPWMDGVGQVTQCQIGPSSSFSYEYTASPSGTFWYHSHSGAQRTDGFYGALVVKENKSRLNDIRTELKAEFQDRPDQHTITLLDWQVEASLDLFTQNQAGLGFYPGKPHGEVPTPSDQQYSATRSFDNGGAGPIPYFSGIINGKGRHVDVPYNKTRLSIFTVKCGELYRFRLVGAQALYSYTFSIDGHKLTVVGTDGYWIEPEKKVDYIMIHPGERYDFLLDAKEEIKDYWIRAETMEIDQSGQGPPYKSLGHVAEAILHYKRRRDSRDPDANVPSHRYEEIKNNSPLRVCTQENPCKAVNCPFKNFHSSYNIICTNVDELRLLEPTPPGELPNANPNSQCRNCTHFINFNFEGESQTSSVNGRNFILPSFPPQTQYNDFREKDTICNLTADCNPSTLECSCVHVIDIPYNETVQMVFSSIGASLSAHPIHLHGHTFHVVAVGYPEYYNTTGYVKKPNSDISCADVNCTEEGCIKERCTRPSWKTEPMNFTINHRTIRKDTVIVPAGGYVVINFLSDNPGQWFLHCHKELHQLEGMALIVNEALEEQRKPPDGLNKCGDVELSYDEIGSGEEPTIYEDFEE